MGISRRSILQAGAGLAATAVAPGAKAVTATSALSATIPATIQTAESLLDGPQGKLIKELISKSVLSALANVRDDVSGGDSSLVNLIHESLKWFHLEYEEDVAFTTPDLLKAINGEIPNVLRENGEIWFDGMLSWKNNCLTQFPEYLKISDLRNRNVMLEVVSGLGREEAAQCLWEARKLGGYFEKIAGKEGTLADVASKIDGYLVRSAKQIVESQSMDGYYYLDDLAEHIEGLDESHAHLAKILNRSDERNDRLRKNERQEWETQKTEEKNLAEARRRAEPDLREPYSLGVQKLGEGEYLVDCDSNSKRPVTRMELVQVWQQAELAATPQGEIMALLKPSECQVEALTDKLARVSVGQNRLRGLMDKAATKYRGLELPNRMQEFYRE